MTGGAQYQPVGQFQGPCPPPGQNLPLGQYQPPGQYPPPGHYPPAGQYPPGQYPHSEQPPPYIFTDKH